MLYLHVPAFRNTKPFFQSLKNALRETSSFKNAVLAVDLNVDISHNSTGLAPAILHQTRKNSCLDHIMVKCSQQNTSVVCQSTLTDFYPVMVSDPGQHSKKCLSCKSD